MQISYKTWVFAFLYAVLCNSATITCPSFSGNTLNSDYGYQHSADNPVTSIKLTSCNSDDRVGPLTSGQYAWINAPKQQYSSGSTSNSQIYQRSTSETCMDKDKYFQTDMNNGRKCVTDYEGVSNTCSDSTGKGSSLGDPGYEHADCDAELAGRRSYIWPYETSCQSWASEGSSGETDYDCNPQNFCWYASASAVTSSSKTCMIKYSASSGVTFGWSAVYSDNLKDAVYNGQYGSSGWAYNSASNTATGFEIQKITDQSGTTLNSPYQGVPTDTTNKGRYYADSTNYVETECEGGLDGNGYCPKPGQTDTSTYTSAMKSVYLNSQGHTLDRDNLSAQTEGGIGNGGTWETAVNYKFKFDYYPFLQGTTPSECLEAVFPQSLTNIYGAFASYFGNTAVVFVVSIVLVLAAF